MKWILWLLLLPLVVLGIYLAFVLNWSYADGERAGYLQKFSKKGWLCKTYEGEMAMTTVPGVMPVIWYFSVRDEAVAKQLDDMAGKRVVLHYEEHRGIPTTCFGETGHFVDRVKEIDELGAMQSAPVQVPQAPQVPQQVPYAPQVR
jgi:hypothetical protein